MRCSVQNCNNDTKKTTKAHGITFHMFPKDKNLRSAWVEALGVTDWEPKDRSTVCSEHFRNDDFYVTKGGLRKIKDGAVPVFRCDVTEDEDAPAALRVCRICLAHEGRMYHLREQKLDQVYEKVTGIFLGDDDKLPQKLCWECAHRLMCCNGFMNKALRTQQCLVKILTPDRYITIRDVKTLTRINEGIKSTLVTRIFEPNDSDVHINEDNFDVPIKPENDQSDDDHEYPENEVLAEVPIMIPNEIPMIPNEVPMIVPEIQEVPSATNLPILQVQIKDETNEIFYDEFQDGIDSDDKKLSEVYAKPKRVRKKKLKDEKKVKIPKKCDDNTPASTMDRYKTNEIKRRKTQDRLDESLFTISSLSYEEQIAEIQKRQELSSYRCAPYKCTICYRGFQIQDRYEAHAVRHSEQSGAYECFICKTRLKTGRALRKHLTAQHTEKFSCKGCPFVTRNRGVAREHEKWHAGTKYQCPHCPSEFDKITTYMGHIRIKHVSDFVCELCGYTFVSKKGIEVHKKKKHRLAEKSVSLEGPYCDVCDVRFVSEDAHARHLKLSSRHSSDNDPNRIRNDSQSMNTEKHGRVIRKIERRPVIHPRDPADRNRTPDTAGPITCEQCGIQLRDLRLYAQHFRRAHPDKNRTKYPAMKTPCMCEQCGKIFQSMALLKDHMWVHTGEKRFKCDRCTKSFTQKTNLVFHMRVHSANRPSYECPLCGKHFAFYNNRRRHMFIHTGLKPFKCDTCGKCFTTSGEQRSHMEHVHLKKPWPKRVRAARARDADHDLWHQKCLQHED